MPLKLPKSRAEIRRLQTERKRFAVEQARNREEDVSAIIRTMEELSGVTSLVAPLTDGASATAAPRIAAQ